jgi:hypothetical protein
MPRPTYTVEIAARDWKQRYGFPEIPPRVEYSPLHGPESSVQLVDDDRDGGAGFA